MAVALNSSHRPPEELSLEVEHTWVTEALNHAHDALEGVHRTALRVARERPEAPIIGLTPHLDTARRLAVVWGVHAVVVPEVHSMTEAVNRAARIASATP